MSEPTTAKRRGPPPARPWLREWDEEILRDWNKPTSIREFARRFGIKPDRVSNAAVRLGLWNKGRSA